MAYQKRYRTVVPVERGADIDVARWLARESFERTAAADCLQLVAYSEREMSVDEIPPKAMETLGRPLTDFDWYEFSGVGHLDKELFDWLSAEIAWNREQVAAWLDAEERERVAADWAARCEAQRA